MQENIQATLCKTDHYFEHIIIIIVVVAALLLLVIEVAAVAFSSNK